MHAVYERLGSLDLKRNELVAFFNNMAFLKALQSLDISFNKFFTINKQTLETLKPKNRLKPLHISESNNSWNCDASLADILSLVCFHSPPEQGTVHTLRCSLRTFI